MKKILLIGLLVSVIFISGCVQGGTYESSAPLIEYENQFNFYDLVFSDQAKQIKTYEEMESEDLCTFHGKKPYNTENIKICIEEFLTIYEIVEKTLLDSKIKACNDSISENSEAIIEFMKDHVVITKERYSLSDIEQYFCTDCFRYTTAYRNTTNDNMIIILWHHNRFFSDASFGETIYCEVNTENEVLRHYIRAGVGHAS